MQDRRRYNQKQVKTNKRLRFSFRLDSLKKQKKKGIRREKSLSINELPVLLLSTIFPFLLAGPRIERRFHLFQVDKSRSAMISPSFHLILSRPIEQR